MNRIISSIPILLLTATFIALLWSGILATRRNALTRSARIQIWICAGIVLIAQLVLVVRAVRIPETERPPTPALERYELTVVLSVPNARTEISQVPFRVGSGSVNLGCEESRQARVEFQLPPGAEHAQADAQWVNTDNLDARSANVQTDGSKIIGTGLIRGQHKTFLFNCPGGGHGELVLSGQYEIKKEFPTEPTVVRSIKDIAYRGQIFTVTLPSPANQPIDVVITVTGEKSSSVLKGTISLASNGALEFSIASRTGSLPERARISDQTLVIEV